MLRNILAILLIAGFCYTAIEAKENFTELRLDRIQQIETALNQ